MYTGGPIAISAMQNTRPQGPMVAPGKNVRTAHGAMIHDFSIVRRGRSLTGADDSAGRLDMIEPIVDFSSATLKRLEHRITQSAGYEQLVYREVELDEAWRLLEASIAEARRTGAATADIGRLERLRDGVVEAHDLVSDATATQRAASRLRAAQG